MKGICYEIFLWYGVIQPIDRTGLAVKGSCPPACCVFCRPECIIADSAWPPSKLVNKIFYMKNGFQIRIQHPHISFGCKFSEFFDDFKIFMKIEAHIQRDRSNAKTTCATSQPPVVLKSTNLRRSYSIIRLYHHTIGKVHIISPSCSNRSQKQRIFRKNINFQMK